MAKESSPQNSPIDLLVKEDYHIMKILHKYNGSRRKTGYCSKTIFIISLNKNILFCKIVLT